jgi:hypothetical protein
MNAITMMRRLEDGGLPHDQAKVLAETICDQVEDTVPTKDFVELVVTREVGLLRQEMIGGFAAQREDFDGKLGAVRQELNEKIEQLRQEMDEKHKSLIKWVAGIMIVQTGTILLGAVGIVRLLAG